MTKQHLRFPEPARRPTGLPTGSFRILFLIAMLLLVLIAMNRAGNPRTWSWLFPDPGPQQDENEVDKSALKPEAGPEISKLNRAAPAISSPKVDSEDKSSKGPLSIPNTSELSHLQLDFWRQVIEDLSSKEQLVLLTLVNHASRQDVLPPGQTATASGLLANLSRRRQDYQLSVLQKATSENSTDLGEAAVELQELWEDHIYPAMQAVVNENVDPELANDLLRDFARTVSQAALSLVSDHTQVAKPNETYAWFSSWARIFDEPLIGNTPEPITINRLLGQPRAYRGAIVTVRGRALRVDAVKAAKNPLGIEKYFVIWIRPDHPSRYPFCVYSLTIPEEISWDEQTRSTQVTDASVVASGEFFKVRLFDAGGPAQAPLILTSGIQINAPVALAQTSSRMPSTSTMLLLLVVIAGLAVITARLVYRCSNQISRRVRTEETNRIRDELEDLRDDARVETLAERLQKLE